MESIEENILEPQEKREQLPFYKAILVMPGFESNKHRSGLFLDTRLNLLAAASYHDSGFADKIVVGGAKIREMDKSFAELMKEELIEKYGIPENSVETEEYTFDTASQVEWAKKNAARFDEKIAFVTNNAQANHVKELLRGYELEAGILSTEDILRSLKKSGHLDRFIEKLEGSVYWKKFEIREKLLALITKYIDPRGERIRKVTQKRLPKNNLL